MMKLDSQQPMMDSQSHFLNTQHMFPSFGLDMDSLMKEPRLDHKLEDLPLLSIPLLQHDLNLFSGPLSSDYSEASLSPVKPDFDAESSPSPTKASYSLSDYCLEHQDAADFCLSLDSTVPLTSNRISPQKSPKALDALKEGWADNQLWYDQSISCRSNDESSQENHPIQLHQADQSSADSEVVNMIESAFASGGYWNEESEQNTNAALMQPEATGDQYEYTSSAVSRQNPQGLGIFVKSAPASYADDGQDEAAGCQNLPASRWRSIVPGRQPLHLDFHGSWRAPNGYAPVHTRVPLPTNSSDYLTAQQKEEYLGHYAGFGRVPTGYSSQPDRSYGGASEEGIEEFQFTMAELAQLHLQNARNRSISKMPLTKLYKMMGLENDHVKAKWREECIMDIVRAEGFDVGNQTWIRDTEDSTRKRIIESIYRQTKEFGYNCELLEIIVRRGTYARMQSRLRQRRRHNKRTMALRQMNH